jgi:hypothetical protein
MRLAISPFNLDQPAQAELALFQVTMDASRISLAQPASR